MNAGRIVKADTPAPEQTVNFRESNYLFAGNNRKDNSNTATTNEGGGEEDLYSDNRTTCIKLQKVQFQRIDRSESSPNCQRALFLFVTLEEDLEEEKQETRGYEVSHSQLEDILRAFQLKCPSFEQICQVAQLDSEEKCVTNTSSIFQVLNAIIQNDRLYSCDIFQSFLISTFKYSLTYQNTEALPLSSSSSSCEDKEESEELIEDTLSQQHIFPDELKEDHYYSDDYKYMEGANVQSSSSFRDKSSNNKMDSTLVEDDDGYEEEEKTMTTQLEQSHQQTQSHKLLLQIPQTNPQRRSLASSPLSQQLQLNPRLSQSGVISNYSQFSPQRLSLSSAFEFLAQNQLQPKSKMKKNRASVNQNTIKASIMESISRSNVSMPCKFENSISRSRQKHVTKIQKNLISGSGHQQLKQAQTLGSISSTNSFEEPNTANKPQCKEEKQSISPSNLQKKGVNNFNIDKTSNFPNIKQQLQRISINLVGANRPSMSIATRSGAKLEEFQQSLSFPGLKSKNLVSISSSNILQLSRFQSAQTPSDNSFSGDTIEAIDKREGTVIETEEQLQDTQVTLTQNSISKEYEDNSISSSSSLDDIQQIDQPLGMVNSIPREKVFVQKRKRVKHQSKTSPDLDTERSNDDKGSGAIHSDGALRRRRKICMKRKKIQEVTPRNGETELEKEKQFSSDLKTEIMFSESNIQENFNLEDDQVTKKDSLDSGGFGNSNSNNNCNAKLLENCSQYDFNSTTEQVKVEDVQIGLVSGDIRKSTNKEKICNLLLNKQYSDLSEIGGGSFGLVLRARTPEGYIRALKIHSATSENTEIEFKLAKFLSSEGTENLSANNIMTYNTIKFRDTASKKMIEVIEMELADDSLKNEIYRGENSSTSNMKTNNNVISDEKFKQICVQLVGNVLSMHNMCVVHRDLKLDNILVSNGKYFLADFGISEEIGPQLIKNFIPGTDCFSIRQNIAGTQLYFSPAIREAHSAHPKQYLIEHDPFKSDIYTVGLILLEIELVRKGWTQKNIRSVLSDKQKAYQYASQININSYLIKDDHYILRGQLYQQVNILAEMLQADERSRISSVKLCLVCQLDKIILSNIIVPHHKIFPPIIDIKNDHSCVIRYYQLEGFEWEYVHCCSAKIKQSNICPLPQTGEYLKTEDGRILRHGKGQLFKLVEEESVIYKMLVFEGDWDNDLPHGKGTFYFFQNEWVYEGDFKNGLFFGQGVVKFIDWVVYKGNWCNFILEDFLVPVMTADNQPFLQRSNKPIEVVINTHDKEGFLRYIGNDEIELQFDTQTFRQYAKNIAELKSYFKDKTLVRIILVSRKTQNDFNYSERQQLLILAANRKRQRKVKVFIRYFKHEPLLDETVLDQLISLLNSNDSLIDHNSLEFQAALVAPSAADDADSDSVIYVNCEFFSKECGRLFLEERIQQKQENLFKIEYLRNIGIPVQVEEESIVKLLVQGDVKNLKELDLSRCCKISSQIFVGLDNRLSMREWRLRSLNLRYEALSISTIITLFNFQFLSHINILDFSYSQFDDQCMGELLKCQQLRSLQCLKLSYCKLISYKGLELASSRLTSTNFPSLNNLDLEAILTNTSKQKDFQDNCNSQLLAEQQLLQTFDQRHHLSSSVANLTLLDAPLNKSFFPYASPHLLQQLQFLQKDNILRKNLSVIDVSQLYGHSFSATPSISNISPEIEDQNADISLSLPTLFPRYSSQKLSMPMSSSPILEMSSPQVPKDSQNKKKLSQNSLVNWINQLTDKNIPAFQKFMKQPKLSRIQTLSLRSTNIDDSILKVLAKNAAFAQLHDLDISLCQKITSEGIESILVSPTLVSLRSIDVSQTRITSISPKGIQLVQLSSLNVTWCDELLSLNLAKFFASKINSMMIAKLFIDDAKFADPKLSQSLAGCSQLEELHVIIPQGIQSLRFHELALNLLLEKGTYLNFYSSEIQMECINNLVVSDVAPKLNKTQLQNQVFINGVQFSRLNRFGVHSEAVRVQKTQILDIASKEVALAQLDEENIGDDLCKLLNSRNFLLVKELDISRLKVNSYAGELLAGSRYTRSLEFIDLSYSSIRDEELLKLSKSKYLSKLEVMKLNHCRDITEKGINHLLSQHSTLHNLRLLELKHRLLNIYLVNPLDKVQIIADYILFKAEHMNSQIVSTPSHSHSSSISSSSQRQLAHLRFEQFAKRWAKIFRDNISNISVIEISGFDENIIDHFLSLITDKNKIKKVLIDFSKKHQKTQTSHQNHDQFVRINQIFCKLPDLTELRLDFSKWKEMTDLSVKILMEGIQGLKALKILELNLSDWGKDNSHITDLSCIFLGNAITKIQQINFISLDLSHWGESNSSVSDKSICYLTEAIFNTKDYLTYLSLKLNCWGSFITNESLYQLSYLLKHLNLLSFLHLGLTEWGKDNSHINDSGIEALTNAIGNSRYLNQLDINLAYAAHLNIGIGDTSVQNLATSLTQIKSLSSLKINLAWWMVDINLYGFNTDVSDISIKDLAKAIGKLVSLTELDLNFDRWGYKNNFIKDESIVTLADNIENLHALSSLSLNFDWWGLGNEKITEMSLNCLASRLNSLSKLTFLQLVLSLDRWKKIEEKQIVLFQEKIMALKISNKDIAIEIR